MAEKTEMNSIWRNRVDNWGGGGGGVAQLVWKLTSILVGMGLERGKIQQKPSQIPSSSKQVSSQKPPKLLSRTT